MYFFSPHFFQAHAPRIRPQSAKSWKRKTDGAQKPAPVPDSSQDMSNLAPNRGKSASKKDSQSFSKSQAAIGNSYIYEKRKMEAEIVALKHSLNICKDENSKLKEQNHKLHKEMENKDMYIKELFTKINVHSSPKHSSSTSSVTNQINSLKKRIEDLTAELSKVKKQKEELSKTNRHTKLHETQAELKTSIEECKRLRGMLDNALKGNVNDIVENNTELQQKIMLKKFILENQELTKTVQKQEKEILKLQQISKRSQAIKDHLPSKGPLPIKSKTVEKPSTTPSKVPKKGLDTRIENELKIIKENLSKCNFFV